MADNEASLTADISANLPTNVGGRNWADERAEEVGQRSGGRSWADLDVLGDFLYVFGAKEFKFDVKTIKKRKFRNHGITIRNMIDMTIFFI